MIETLELEISQDDINKANKADQEGKPKILTCPVAQAALRQGVKNFELVTHDAQIKMFFDNPWVGDDTAQKFVEDYDGGKGALPTVLFFTKRS